jgi:hypothetical protein
MGKKDSKRKVSKRSAGAEVESRTGEPVAVEPSPEEREKLRVEGIKKTVIPGIIGIAAGVALFSLIGDGTEQRAVWFSIIFIMLAFAYYLQRIIYPLIGVNPRSFGKKDWFYVEFIVLDFALVCWTILLNL